jgi:hypothetical protein
MRKPNTKNDPRYSFHILHSYADPVAYARYCLSSAFRIHNRHRTDVSALEIARCNRMMSVARALSLAAV